MLLQSDAAVTPTPEKRVKPPRQSNLELYRILVMLLIVAHHYVVNSGLAASGGPILAAPLSLRSLFLLGFGAFGKIGINCFAMITGYFMCKSRITANKFFKLLFEVMFYKIVIYAIFLVSGYEAFSLEGLVKALLPVYSIGTGFVGAFLFFFLCIPFLNILVGAMNELQHIALLAVCFLIYVVFGTVPFLTVTMNYVSWLIVLYFIASYIRLYPKKIYEKTRLWLLLTLGSILLCLASVAVMTWIGSRVGRNLSYMFVSDANTLLAVITAVCSFLLFKNLKMKHHPLINTVAASTFGILLIHTASETMRRWLWVDLLQNTAMYSSKWLYLHAVGSVLAIFAVCFVIDFLRIRLLERPFFCLWDRLWARVTAVYTRVRDRLSHRLHADGE